MPERPILQTNAVIARQHVELKACSHKSNTPSTVTDLISANTAAALDGRLQSSARRRLLFKMMNASQAVTGAVTILPRLMV